MGNTELQFENGNGKMEPMQMEDAEANPKGQGQGKVPYPKGVFFIMATELSERFSYYGMRAVLTIYMRNVLNFTENVATSYYHVFLMLCYGLPIIWGVISDSWLGKFKTILFVSILFAVGNIILTLSSIPPLNFPTTGFFFVGLILMAVGTAGMKPCVAPLGGEQFILPQQTTQLQYFFSIFFFVVTIGNMISTVITPVFRRDISCFDMDNCYPLAFGVPASIMLLAIIIFACGRPLYKVNKPSGNMLMKVTKCVAHALTNRKKVSTKDGKSKHWLDSASDSYDERIIADTKGLFRILPYFLPVPMFFALYEQLGSRWTLQATRMNGRIGSFSIKPDQMQVSNAILMFISLPLFNWVVYPLLGKAGIRLRTLQRMVIGGVLAAMSFGVAGIVSTKINPTIKTEPSEGHSVVTFVNGLPCPLNVWTDPSTTAVRNYTVLPEDVFTLPQLPYPEEKMSLLVKTVSDNCSISNRPFQGEWTGEVRIIPRAYQTITFNVAGNRSLSARTLPFKDDFKKSKDGNARVRFVLMEAPSVSNAFQVRQDGKIVIRATNDKDKLTKSFPLQTLDSLLYTDTEEIDESTYDINYESSNSVTRLIKSNVKLDNGGSYNLISFMSPNSDLTTPPRSQLVIVTPPNSIHILWLIPQYVLMAWGEILFIVSGMEFAYTEAPLSMKSVVQAIWHLMNAFGNVIVIISAQNDGHSSQALEFFIFAGLMLIDSIIYYLMARRYKYVAVDGNAVVMH